MKVYIIILVVFISISFSSCTDVIDVEVPVAEPRLVIEASIDWEKGTLGNEQMIRLSTSRPYFDANTVNSVTGAMVKITNNTDDTEFVFEDMNDGTYTTNSFVPVLNQKYTLEVTHNGETFIAEETMTPVVDIANVYQSLDGGFNVEALEVNIDFDDLINEENYYYFKFKDQDSFLPELLTISDRFTNGRRMTVFYEKVENDDINQKELKAGDVVDINFYGISKQYFNYISLLIDQYDSGNSPFQTTPVALKGNCLNIQNPDNNAFGYFRLSQVVKTSYTLQ